MISCRPQLLALRSCLLFAICLFPVAFASAQSTSATLSGTVTDAQGALVPGARVTVTNAATGLKREATTNGSGSFSIPLLPPSTYTVLVENQGFTPAEIRDVVLNVNDNVSLNIELKVGQVGATVDVKNDAPLINESPAVGTTVDRQFVGNLPLNGRSFQSLVTLTPGVVLTPANVFNPGQFSVNGQRADSNYFTVDGVSANVGVESTFSLGAPGAGATPGLTASGGTNGLVSVDALQEFRIQTSTYAPEFGRQPGGQVQILTRSGTNEFHGTLFEYFRNDVLDANDWFANSRRLPKPPLRQHDFGGVFGGPLHLPRFGEGGPAFYSGKNRTFFFFSYEGLRLRLPQTRITSVPTVNARQLAPPGIRPLLDAFPLPNGRDLGNNVAEFNAAYSNPSTVNATSIRIDHTPSDKLTLFGRYNYAPSSNISRSTPVSVLNPATSDVQTLTVGSTWVLSPTLNNEFRANWSRTKAAFSAFADDFGGATPPPDSILFPLSFSRQNALFSFNITGPGQLAIGRFGPENLQRQINLVDTFGIAKGNHQLKLGVDYRYLSPVKGAREYGQLANFSSVARALTANANSVTVSASESFTLAYHNFSAFAQDTWRVNKRLTLTYGLRWELNPPPKGKDGKDLFTAVGIDSPATIVLAPAGTPLYKTTYNNFAPRFGLSYLLSDKQGRETALRGGFGIFHDLGSGEAASASTAFPYARARGMTNVAYPLSPANAEPPPFDLNPPVVLSIFAFDPNLKLPRTYQWNLTVEQSFGVNQTVTASYVGAQGRRLLQRVNLSRPNPRFNSVIITTNAASSDYRALQLQFNRRLSNRLQALVSYTWSRSEDTFSSNAADQGGGARGPSDFDVRHAFSTAISYDLRYPAAGAIGNAILRNWSLDTIIYVRSATPVDLIGGFGNLAFVSTVFRPDLVPGQPLYIDDPLVPGGRRFNPAAFTPPPAGRQGTLGRNALRGFPAWQVDMALRRQFNLTERVNLQLRAEFFNIFNHPNFGAPGNFAGNCLDVVCFSGRFGQSTQMLGRSLNIGGGLNPLYQVGGPRSIQLALKLNF